MAVVSAVGIGEICGMLSRLLDPPRALGSLVEVEVWLAGPLEVSGLLRP